MWLLFSELGDSEDRETGKDQNPGVNSSQVHCSLESVSSCGGGGVGGQEFIFITSPRGCSGADLSPYL